VSHGLAHAAFLGFGGHSKIRIERKLGDAVVAEHNDETLQ